MISQRAMRNQNAALLRAVVQGESVFVTDRGGPTAVISPYKEDQHSLERVQGSGQTVTLVDFDMSAALKLLPTQKESTVLVN